MRHRRTLTALYTTIGLQGAGVAMSGLALPFLIERFHVDKAAGGLIPGISALGFAVGAVIGGRLSDTWGRSGTIRSGLAVTALGNIGLAASPIYPVALAVGLASGIGSGFMEGGSNAATVDIAGDDAPRALNILHFCFGIGAVAGPIAFALLLRITGQWWSGLVFVGISLLAAFGATFLVRFPPRPGPRPARQHHQQLAVRRFIVIAGILMFAYVALEFGYGQWAFAYLTQGLGASPSVASWAVSGFYLFLAIGRLITARLSRDISVERILLGLVGFSLVAASIIPFVSLAPAIVASCLLGLGFSGIFPLVLALGGRAAPGSGGVMGILVAVGGAGGVVSPPLIGAVADRSGLPAAMLVITGGCLVMLFCVLALPRALSRALPRDMPPGLDEAPSGLPAPTLEGGLGGAGAESVQLRTRER